MRDGVKLKTFILVPKGASGAPMLLTRTPYNASNTVARFASPHLASVVPQMFDTAVAAGYIIVCQDVRGKYGSEGDYVMTRPLRYVQPDDDRPCNRPAYGDRLAREECARATPRRRDGGSYGGFPPDVGDPPAPGPQGQCRSRPVDGWMG
jgi:hypothetical protein